MKYENSQGLRKIGRQLAGYRGLNKEGQRRLMRRTMVAITSFVCGYTAQIIAPIFNWSWALYAFLRSLLAMCRLLIPLKYQPESKYVYSLIHGSLPYFIAYNAYYISSSYLAFFKMCLDQERESWNGAYGIGTRGNHHHGIIAPCKRHVHDTHDESCLLAFIKDGIRVYKTCFTFYFKFYLLTSLLGGINFLKRLLKHPNIVLPKLINQSIRSSMFLFLSFHIPSRIHCPYQWLLNKYHKEWKLNCNKYNSISSNNLFMMLTLASVFGSYCIRLELSESKRTDIALFSVWRTLEVWIRMICNLDSYEKDYGHFVLGSKHLSAILFGLACGMAVYVHATNPKSLKSLERSILKYTLA